MLLGECLEYVHKSRVPVSQVSDASLHTSTTYSLRHTETVKLFHIGWDSLSLKPKSQAHITCRQDTTVST